LHTFFDEIDALVTKRGGESERVVMERMASQFFNELDSLTDLSQVIVVGATNREDLLDPALLRAGRFDFVLNFPVPDQKERLEIFQIHTREKPLSPDVDLVELAKCTEGMVGSHIEFICKRATMLAIAELINDPERKKSRKLTVSATYFNAALKEVQEKEGLLKC